MDRMFVVAVVAAYAAACVERGDGPTTKKIDPSYIQAHLLAAPPNAAMPGFERFDVAFGDSAVYLGNKIDRSRVAPGQTVTITHYWQVRRAPGPRWRVFTLLRGAPGSADFTNPDASDMQRGHGPAQWEAGEIIEDIHAITIRPDWRSKVATIHVGLIEYGKHGPLDRMEATGGRPGAVIDRAIVARTIEIDLSRAPPPKGTIHVARAAAPILIDGTGGDVGWSGAATSELVTAEGGSDPVGKATVKMTWDDQFLYVFATIADTDIVSPFKQQDDPLWKGDCIELFIDADGNRSGYVELQANPAGVSFDSWFATTRAKPGDEAWDSGMVVAAKLRGNTAESDTGDQGWDVEIGIPWAAVKGRAENMAVALPPRIGDRWRLNVVRVDRRSGARPNEVTASSWNRITMSDFHALDRMLTAVFADGSGAIVAPTAPAPGSDGKLAPDNLLFTRVTLASSVAADARTIELLDIHGQQKIDGKQVADADLASALSQLEGKVVALRAGANVIYQPRVTALIERLEDAGITELTVLTAADFRRRPPPAGAGPVLPPGIPPDNGLLEITALAAGARIVGRDLGDDELEALLAAIAARHAALEVVVRPDQGVRFGRVQNVLERAARAGFATLAIAPPAAIVPGAAEALIAALAPGAALEIAVSNVDVALVGSAPNTSPVKLDDAQLVAVVRTAFAKDKRPVVIAGDVNASHARVLAVVDALRGAGVATFAFKSVELALPPSAATPTATTIDLSIAGGMVFDGKPVLEGELTKQLAELKRPAAVTVRADRGVSHGRVLAVLDQLTRAGITFAVLAVR